MDRLFRGSRMSQATSAGRVVAVIATLFAFVVIVVAILVMSRSEHNDPDVGVSPDPVLAVQASQPPVCPLCTRLEDEIAILKRELEGVKSYLSRTDPENKAIPASSSSAIDEAVQRRLGNIQEQSALRRDLAEARKRVGYLLDSHSQVREHAERIVDEVSRYFGEMRALCVDLEGVSTVPLRGTVDRATWENDWDAVRNKARLRLQAYLTEGGAESVLRLVTPQEYLKNQ